MLLGAGRHLRTLLGRDFRNTAGGCDGKFDLPARPDDQHAPGRDRHGRNLRLGMLAGTQAWEITGGFAV